MLRGYTNKWRHLKEMCYFVDERQEKCYFIYLFTLTKNRQGSVPSWNWLDSVYGLSFKLSHTWIQEWDRFLQILEDVNKSEPIYKTLHFAESYCDFLLIVSTSSTPPASFRKMIHFSSRSPSAGAANIDSGSC